MKKLLIILFAVFLFAHSAGCSEPAAGKPDTAPPASGAVVDGYRILTVQNAAGGVDLTVYRGDYIKFQFDASIQDPLLSIPELGIRERLPADPGQAPYYKMKTPGTFAFSVGDINGKLTVVNYRQPSYREVSSREAAELIKNEQPLILDVRTPHEYKQGHLANSVLIPVQELQRRYHELGDQQDREILVYCATGNRSTVASKILIDNGFKHIVNLRGGIYDWSRKNYPVTR